MLTEKVYNNIKEKLYNYEDYKQNTPSYETHVKRSAHNILKLYVVNNAKV